MNGGEGGNECVASGIDGDDFNEASDGKNGSREEGGDESVISASNVEESISASDGGGCGAGLDNSISSESED